MAGKAGGQNVNTSRPPEHGWSVKMRRIGFQNTHVRIEERLLDTPHRRGVSWTVVERRPAVAVLAITPDQEIILLRQERPAVEQALWEIPAGQVDGEPRLVTNEVLRETALRELREETGYVLNDVGSIEPLGTIFTSPGYSNEQVHLFIASPVVLASAGASPEESECIIEVRLVDWKELKAMIWAGKLQDGLSLSAFARVQSSPYNESPDR